MRACCVCVFVCVPMCRCADVVYVLAYLKCIKMMTKYWFISLNSLNFQMPINVCIGKAYVFALYHLSTWNYKRTQTILVTDFNLLWASLFSWEFSTNEISYWLTYCFCYRNSGKRLMNWWVSRNIHKYPSDKHKNIVIAPVAHTWTGDFFLFFPFYFSLCADENKINWPIKEWSGLVRISLGNLSHGVRWHGGMPS